MSISNCKWDKDLHKTFLKCSILIPFKNQLLKKAHQFKFKLHEYAIKIWSLKSLCLECFPWILFQSQKITDIINQIQSLCRSAFNCSCSHLDWIGVRHLLDYKATIKEITDQNYETYYKSSTLNKRGSYQLHHQLLCLEEHLLKPCLCLWRSL